MSSRDCNKSGHSDKTCPLNPGFLREAQTRAKNRDRVRRESNPYRILGIDTHTNHSLIRESWKKLVRELHPDKCDATNSVSQGEATKLIQKVNEAWQSLDSKERSQAPATEQQRTRPWNALDVSRFRAKWFDAVRKEGVYATRQTLRALPVGTHALHACILIPTLPNADT